MGDVLGLVALLKDPAERIRLGLSTAATAEADAAAARAPDGCGYEQLQQADAAVRKFEARQHMEQVAENERERQRKNHEAEQKARTARQEQYRAENGL
jgi:hypothetical protein